MPDGTPHLHFIQFFDAHSPQDPPSRPFFVDAANNCEAEAAFPDRHFKEWFDDLPTKGMPDDALLAMFGDHGDDLDGWCPFDKGGAELGHPEETGRGCRLCDQTIAVPIAIWHKDLESREIDTQAGLVDIVPTVLDLLDAQSPAPLDGHSLAGIVCGGDAMVEQVHCSKTHCPREQVEATNGEHHWTHDKKSVRIGNRCKIVFRVDSDLVDMFDLRSDPMEKGNLVRGMKDQ